MTHWFDTLTYGQVFMFSLGGAIVALVGILVAISLWTRVEWWWHTNRGHIWVMTSRYPLRGHWEKP